MSVDRLENYDAHSTYAAPHSQANNNSHNYCYVAVFNINSVYMEQTMLTTLVV